MAGVIHISEAEAARDFSAVVDRALAGEEIVVRRDGKDVVKLSSMSEVRPKGRTLGEMLAMLKEIKATQGLATLDDEFAADMEKVRAELNAGIAKALDEREWD